MKITKTVKGENYYFYINFIPNEMKVTVRPHMDDYTLEGTLSDDFTTITLPKGSVYINGKEITVLKLNRYQKIEAIDYNKIKQNEQKC